MASAWLDDGDEPMHVHDLPQLYTHPSAETLIATLGALALTPTTFSSTPSRPSTISPAGLPTYLTQIVSSPLAWLDPSAREDVYTLAATRLAERAGRSAAPDMTRLFEVTNSVTVELHEPSLTGDMLGLKTWSSSLMLARRLETLKSRLPGMGEKFKVLELGAGTGLVGIAAACLWRCEVVVSDLPEIVANLQENVRRNQALIDASGGKVSARPLDWGDVQNAPDKEGGRFPVIVAADPLYSPEHPGLLVAAVGRWMKRSRGARFVVEVPLREGYEREREEMRQKLQEAGLEIEQEGEDVGVDDWEGEDGEQKEVRCAWIVWKGGGLWCTGT